MSERRRARRSGVSTIGLVLILGASALGCGGGGGGGGGTPVVSNLRSISAGTYHSVALELDGTLWAWGSNDACQLAELAGVDLEVAPVEVPGGAWVAASAGGEHTLAIAQDGAERTLWGWGLNLSGQAGYWWTDGSVDHPERIGAETDWESVSAGWVHSAAIRQDGSLWTWGWNTDGQLGVLLAGGETSTSSPTQVRLDPAAPSPSPRDTGWARVSAGQYHTMGLQADGSLWAWGENAHGQLGILTAPAPNPPNQPLPVQVPGAWRAVAAGAFHTIAIRADGTLWGWGNDDYGQVGNGPPESGWVQVPDQLGDATDWAEVSAGWFHSAALKADGTLWTWGDAKVVGEGALENRHEPNPVAAGTRWTGVSAGGSHTLALQPAEGLHAWGDNGYGQLGIGSHEDKIVPEPIAFPP